jgi:hypothetical protein
MGTHVYLWVRLVHNVYPCVPNVLVDTNGGNAILVFTISLMTTLLFPSDHTSPHVLFQCGRMSHLGFQLVAALTQRMC